MKRFGIFLIGIALIAGMVGCGEVALPTRYSLTMAVAPGGSGTATDLTNASPYAAGTSINIKAVANPGYHFVNWTASADELADTNATETTFTMPTQNVTITANFAEGQIIRTWYDLDDARDHLDSHFILVNNLDSTTAGYTELASPTANQGKGWQPIGTFIGSFDGRGYEIRGLFINRPDENSVGLFGIVMSGVIKDIGVVNATVTGGDLSVGGLVGRNYKGTVSDSYATGSVTGNQPIVGGLMGWNDGLVSDSYSSGNVTGNSSVGGLVGLNEGTVSNSYSTGTVIGNSTVGALVGGNAGNVSNSYSTGSVTGNDLVGGLVGAGGGTVSNSYSTASVTGKYAAGGLVGDNMGTVTNSYSIGRVTGEWSVGGLVGVNVEGIVNNSYSTGSVTGNDLVGGLVGHQNTGTVSNSYSTGSVTGNDHVGGLVGWNLHSTVSDSFWDIETSGQATSDGGTGKMTAGMKSFATFTAWNIITVVNPSTRNSSYAWNIVNGQTYPFLSWQPTS